MSDQPNPCGCLESTLGYMAWHNDADRRYKSGQRQVWCKVCRRWRWPDQVGKDAVTLTKAQYSRMVKKEGQA